ncbi:MAG: hypothetical protein HZA89_08470 [Verrucomicrobia bacterium]|nr:hypothetical protein [Verrucomicrobiota bacterium]
MNTPFHHPYRIDAPTLARAASAAGASRLLNSSQLPENVRFVAINPAVFTHAYLLLGEQPQRFVSDLTLYLSTVRTFFERADAVGGINVPAGANSDSRRRLSEDLGVALAAFFMVEVFGLSWKSVSQIPQNSKLSKKRPDFQGYTATSQRYLFEAKGTTKMQTVEKTMSKALSQVKSYPETAEAKIAIVSYLSADERFFPSTSFVVDPPALPEEVKADAETSRLLHFEKVLQFAGLPQTAKDYVSTLSQRLREKHRIDDAGAASVARTRRIEGLQEELRAEFVEESQPNALETHRYHDSEFLGRSSESAVSKIKVFFGVQRQALEAGVRFEAVAQPLATKLTESETEINSLFADGTLLHVTGLNGGKT